MADDNKEAQSQLDIQNQINKVLQSRTAILKNQSKFLTAQSQLAAEMCNALDCEGLEGMQDRLNDIQQGLEEAGDEAERLATSAQNAGSSINKMASGGAKKGGLLSKAFSPMGGMFAGLGVGIMSAFKGATNMVGGFIKTAGRITGIIGSIGKSLLMLPFSLLNNLTSFAAGAGGGVSALREAMEEVRETFGSLASNEGKAVTTGFRNMQKQSQSLGGSGLRLSRVFGPGRDGAAAALKSVSEQMTDLGPLMSKFAGEIQNNAGVFEVYRRGLGLTGDQFKNLGTLASTTGQSLESTLDSVGSQAINMGKQFGISSKLIAGDMASMLGDVANYGTLSIKQVSALAVYTRKLGIEAKELNGVIDSWDNFEDAAKGASRLSQAFGMNIDAMQMMNEQDPGKRMDMLRESFQATGKSVEELSRQELKLLASQMGLSEEAAKKALSSDMDYDEILAGSEDAEAKTISQAEAMKELADAIKQTFKGGGSGPKTFMEALTSGFERGIMRGKGMRKMLRNIRGSMKQVYRFGRDLGKMFIDLFPGIQEMIGALTDIFNPARFARLRRDLLGAFRQLFLDLRSDPKAGVETFVERIKDIFSNFFQGSGGAGEAFLNGLKTFGKAVALLFLSLVPVMMKGLAKLIHKLADFIRDPSAFTDAAVGMGDGLQQALGSAWQNIVDTWPILKEAFYDLWDAVKPALGQLWEVIWPYILSAVIFKTVLAVAANMTLGAIWGVLFKGFKALFSTSLSKGAAEGGKEGEKTMKKGGGFINALKKVIRDIAKLKIGDVMKAIANVAILIVFLGVSLVGLAFALKKAVEQVKDVDETKLAVMTALLIGLMFSMPGVAAAAVGLKKVNFKEMMSAMFKMGAAVIVMGATVWILGGILANMPEISNDDITNFFQLMGTMMIAGLIAILLAIPVGMIADKFGMQIAIGLGVLGIVMIALGGIGYIIGSMLGSIPNPEGVAAMMNAISKMMIVTALMLPIAGALGLMLMSFPFGTAGVAVIVLGFGVLGGLATAMVSSLIPAIRTIAGIRLQDPESFTKIVNAILAIVQAIEGFVNAIARVMEALRPGLADLAAGKSMEDNIKAATGFVDSVLKGGILPLIDRIVAIAKDTNITESGLTAIKSIGEILKAIGSILQSMMPDPEIIKAVADMDSWYSSGRAERMMDKLNQYMITARESAMGLLKYVAEEFFTETLLGPLRGIDPGAAKVLAAMGPILEGISSALDAMKPSDAMMETVQKSRGFWGTNQGPEMMNLMTGYMQSMKEPIVALIDAIGDNLVKILDKVKGIISTIGSLDVDPQIIEPIVNLVVGVMEAMGNMMSGIGPAVKAAQEIASNFSNSGQSFRMNLTAIGGMMREMGGAFTEMMPAISDTIQRMVNIAKTIDNPEQAVKQIDAIVKAMEVIQIISEQFGGTDSPLANFYTSGQAEITAPLQAAHHNMVSFNNWMLGTDSPLQEFITRLMGLTVPRGADAKAEAMGKVFGALGVILDGLDRFKQMAPRGATAGNNDSGALAEINQAITYMQDIDYDGIKTVMEQVGAGNWDFSTRKVEYRAKGAEHLSEFLTNVNRAGNIDLGTGFTRAHQIGISNAKIILEQVGGGDWEFNERRITSRGEAITTLANFMRTFGDARSHFERGNAAGYYLSIMGHSMVNGVDWLQLVLEGVTNNIDPSIQTRFSASIAAVETMILEYNELNNLLATLDPIDMEANLRTFGDNMALTTESITIDHKPINITVSLNVSMNADDIALAIGKDSASRQNVVTLSKKGGVAQQ